MTACRLLGWTCSARRVYSGCTRERTMKKFANTSQSTLLSLAAVQGQPQRSGGRQRGSGAVPQVASRQIDTDRRPSRSADAVRRPAGVPGPRGDGGGADGASGPLVYREQSVVAPAQRASVEARRLRFERRAVSSRWLVADAVGRSKVEFVEGLDAYVDTATGEVMASGWVRPPRPARCGWRLGGDVMVHADETTGTAHLSGTERCGSIWACPPCAAVIRAERAGEIETAVQAHQAAGGSVLFVTLTLRHRKTDSLAMLVDGLLGSFRKVLQGAAWKSAKARYGITGYIRSTEVTYSKANGWHPHVHALVLCKDALTEAQAETFGDEIHGRWARYAQAATGRMPSRERGVDVQMVDSDGRVLAGYLGKVQDEGHRVPPQGWGVGAELARSDVKTARSGGLVPFELLDETSDLPEGMRRRLWIEFYTATRGRRAMSWSRGLKDALGVNERTDEEIVEDVQAMGETVAVIPAEVYDRLRRDEPGTLALVLDFAGRGRADVLPSLVPGILPVTWKEAA